jgi:uncharacterized protein YoxC
LRGLLGGAEDKSVLDFRMKLQKTTWMLVIVAILLGVTVTFIETQNRIKQQQNRDERKQIFNFVEQDIQTLTIKTQKTLHQRTQPHLANDSTRKSDS